MYYDILFPFVRSDFGGSYVSASILIRELQSSGHEITVVLPWKGVAFDYFIKNEITPILLWGGRPYNSSSFFWKIFILSYMLFSASFYLFRNNFDLIHCNDDRSILLWGLLAKVFRIKTVWHLRNSVASKYDLIRCKLSDKVISVSKYTSSRLGNSIVNHVIYNPVYFNKTLKFSSIQHREIFHDPNLSVLLHIGRDVSGKRLDWSIAACIKLAEQVESNIKLLVIGSPQKKIINIPLNLSIDFIEHLPNIYLYLMNCDLVLHPSNGSKFGLDRVLQECIVLNKQCICTDTGANIELSKFSDKLYYSLDNKISFINLVTDTFIRCKNLPNSLVQKSLFDKSKHCLEVMSVYNEILKR